MDNQEQKYLNKIKYAKEFLKDKQETLTMYRKQLFNADKKYVGEMLEQREKELSKWIDETQVEEEMAETYITEVEDFLKQDNSISLEEEKVNKIQADISNDELQ